MSVPSWVWKIVIVLAIGLLLAPHTTIHLVVQGVHSIGIAWQSLKSNLGWH